MVEVKNFLGVNDNLTIIEEKGIFKVFQHNKDLSVHPQSASVAYYMSQMNCVPKQVCIILRDNAVRLKPGAMQFMAGSVSQETGLKGAADFFGKMARSVVTDDAAIKPLYKGNGVIVTEPTYMYPIIENVTEWDGLVCDDGMFICCDDEVKEHAVMRSNFSSAVAGKEGLFNLLLEGNGLAVLKSRCPREELYELVIKDDCVKIDGNMAVCWSDSLEFTVERSGKTLLGSAASGEGLVNVYRGTGKILMAPK